MDTPLDTALLCETACDSDRVYGEVYAETVIRIDAVLETRFDGGQFRVMSLEQSRNEGRPSWS